MGNPRFSSRDENEEFFGLVDDLPAFVYLQELRFDALLRLVPVFPDVFWNFWRYVFESIDSDELLMCFVGNLINNTPVAYLINTLWS